MESGSFDQDGCHLWSRDTVSSAWHTKKFVFPQPGFDELSLRIIPALLQPEQLRIKCLDSPDDK
jgi:hypothetical protein